MKKLITVFAMFVAMTFAACGNSQKSADAVDSTAVDSAVVDSASIADSIAADSAVAE